MTAIVYLYDDDGNLIEKKAILPTDVKYSSSDDGIVIERTEYMFRHYRLVDSEEIRNDNRTI